MSGTPAAAVLAWAMALAPATAPAQADGRRSGLADMSPALQALQRDDSQNPAMLWVQDGAALWRTPAVPGNAKACADCHGPAEAAMRGVAARHPAWDAATQAPLNLGGRINACRVRHQQASPWTAEQAPLLALSAYIGLQSRGLPLQPADDVRLQAWQQRGQAIWQQRLGQLDLSCAHCHDQRAGLRLGGATIPQGHPTGYPVYRLEWQSAGSLQRRLRGCLLGVRAEPWPADAPEWLQLEAWLARRASGMAVDTPAVRP